MKTADSTVIAVNMYTLSVDSAIKLLTTCNALLLTGGEDVDPVNYGKINELNKCEEINRYRDSLEFALIRRAIEMKMPIFGICRGEQILNVALGGTLYTDIPTDFDTTEIHRCPSAAKSCLHSVAIRESLLYNITGQEAGMVNSYHHQAVEKPAPGLKISAYSSNKVPEAIESDNTVVKSFLMGVQWHPERLSQNPSLALPLAKRFVTEARKYHRN
jgi:putative glutamine amidotransferase